MSGSGYGDGGLVVLGFAGDGDAIFASFFFFFDLEFFVFSFLLSGWLVGFLAVSYMLDFVVNYC